MKLFEKIKSYYKRWRNFWKVHWTEMATSVPKPSYCVCCQGCQQAYHCSPLVAAAFVPEFPLFISIGVQTDDEPIEAVAVVDAFTAGLKHNDASTELKVETKVKLTVDPKLDIWSTSWNTSYLCGQPMWPW